MIYNIIYNIIYKGAPEHVLAELDCFLEETLDLSIKVSLEFINSP